MTATTPPPAIPPYDLIRAATLLEQRADHHPVVISVKLARQLAALCRQTHMIQQVQTVTRSAD